MNDLYEEAREYFGVSAAYTAHSLRPFLYDVLWPNNEPPVSVAWLCEVILTSAYATKTNQGDKLTDWLKLRGIKTHPLAQENT